MCYSIVAKINVIMTITVVDTLQTSTVSKVSSFRMYILRMFETSRYCFIECSEKKSHAIQTFLNYENFRLKNNKLRIE